MGWRQDCGGGRRELDDAVGNASLHTVPCFRQHHRRREVPEGDPGSRSELRRHKERPVVHNAGLRRRHPGIPYFWKEWHTGRSLGDLARGHLNLSSERQERPSGHWYGAGEGAWEGRGRRITSGCAGRPHWSDADAQRGFEKEDCGERSICRRATALSASARARRSRSWNTAPRALSGAGDAHSHSGGRPLVATREGPGGTRCR
mmetsp:Transcript_26176/g.59052  ORF Transcript_26176/g.59052 Transcript_26176/m.59052 type:complete len:204 (-) Transcript_26176:366-977(-)